MNVLEFATLMITGFVACAEFGSYAFVHPVIRRLPPAPVPCQNPFQGHQDAISRDHAARWYSPMSPPRTSRRRIGIVRSITRPGSWLGGRCIRP